MGNKIRKICDLETKKRLDILNRAVHTSPTRVLVIEVVVVYYWPQTGHVFLFFFSVCLARFIEGSEKNFLFSMFWRFCPATIRLAMAKRIRVGDDADGGGSGSGSGGGGSGGSGGSGRETHPLVTVMLHAFVERGDPFMDSIEQAVNYLERDGESFDERLDAVIGDRSLPRACVSLTKVVQDWQSACIGTQQTLELCGLSQDIIVQGVHNFRKSWVQRWVSAGGEMPVMLSKSTTGVSKAVFGQMEEMIVARVTLGLIVQVREQHEWYLLPRMGSPRFLFKPKIVFGVRARVFPMGCRVSWGALCFVQQRTRFWTFVVF
jgi:hypothetical protein